MTDARQRTPTPPRSDTRETLERVRRIETRLTQLLIVSGVDTQQQRPMFQVEHGEGTIVLPSPHSSLKEIIAAVPTDWTGPFRVVIGDTPVGVLSLMDRT